jgi:hypothetical protein
MSRGSLELHHHNHARALRFIASDPDVRLRDLAVGLEVTERTAYEIVTDLTRVGLRDQRTRRAPQQAPPPGPPPAARHDRPARTIGEVLDLLAERYDSPAEPTGTTHDAAT